MEKLSLGWHKLDNSALIYPMLMTDDKQNIFRITYAMDTDVDASLLEKAVEIAFNRFPSFKVKLMKGLFWYYFDKNERKFKVKELDDIQLKRIDFTKNNDYCFRISYYKKLIVVDFFHVLCDGTGGSEFLKCVIYYYLQLQNVEIVNEGQVLTCDVPIDSKEFEDSFVANFNKTKIKDLKIHSLTGEPAYHIEGDLINKAYGSNIIHLYCKSSDLLDVSKSKNSTITEFMGGAFSLALYRAQIEGKKQNTRPFQIMCPINLRKMFGSKSLKNFSLFSRVEIPTNNLTLDDAIKRFHDSIKRDNNKELMQQKINTTVMGEKFFLFRILPLVFKQAIFNFSNLFVGKSNKTATVSNIGIARLPNEMAEHIQSIAYSVSVNSKTPISMTIGTFGEDTCITFTSILKSTDIEREFVGILNEFGVDLRVVSNSVEARYEMQTL